MVLPADLRSCLDRFEAFYSSRYQGRRLLWAHSLERCVVSARFPKGRKDLEVSLFQVRPNLTILLLLATPFIDWMSNLIQLIHLRATGFDSKVLQQSGQNRLLGNRVSRSIKLFGDLT